MRTGHSSMNSARRGWLAHCVVATFSIVYAAACSTASAQCADWVPGPLWETDLGANGPVHAITTWDPDGGGPLPEWLVIGGEFTTVGTSQANNIAAWDGLTWRGIGSGVNGPVYALASVGSDLYVGGEFNSAGLVAVNNIARWNESNGWNHLRGGMGYLPTVPAIVRGLIPYAGAVAATGRFTTVNVGDATEATANHVARWNGAYWQPFDTGLGGTLAEGRALKVYSTSLYVGGHFSTASGNVVNNIARWNGSTWVALGGGTGGTVYTLEEYNSTLYVGGSFTTVNGTSLNANNIARWNGGTWNTVGNGVNAGVYAMRVLGGDLAVGGFFTQIGVLPGGLAVNYVARWNSNTSSWAAMSSGVGVGAVRAMAIYQGILAVGGSFGSAGGNPAQNIAQWNGANWLVLQAPHDVNVMTVMGGRVFAGGYFARNLGPVSGTVRHVAAWSGGALVPLGWGTNNRVRAMLPTSSGSGPGFISQLIVAGDFTSAGPDAFGLESAATRVARWNEPLVQPPYWSAMGNGFNNSVYALAHHAGFIVAGGAFTASGATSISRLAVWNTSSSQWEQFAGGANGTIRAMKVYLTGPIINQTSNLVIGGEFTAVNGLAHTRIARRTDTFVSPGSWFTMGDGFNNTVHAIERHNNEIYAAGAFTASGATPLNRIARWNGSAWVDVGGGFDGTVFTLYSSGGYLYAGGAFSTAGGLPRARAARWNGVQWEDLNGGVNSTLFAFTAYNNEVHAGGLFTKARNNTVDSLGWARYSLTGLPWFTQHPESQQRACGATVQFTYQSAPGYTFTTRRWHKDGVPLNNGAQPSGSSITGATSSTLTITNLGQGDAGDYTCVLTFPCGQAITDPATLTMIDCCPADTNSDGLVNVTDLLAVIGAWGSTSPTTADINGDGIVNVTDLLAVIGAWGACP